MSDPFHPVETGSVRIGGIVGRRPHPARPGQPLSGGPQLIEVAHQARLQGGDAPSDSSCFPS